MNEPIHLSYDAPIVGRLIRRDNETAKQALLRARKMPWWRDDLVRDTRVKHSYWVYRGVGE